MVQLVEIPNSESHPVAQAYRAHAERLLALGVGTFHISRQDVEPLVNDVFVSYLRHHGRVRDTRAWLTGAMRNACAEYWRRHGYLERADYVLRIPVDNHRHDSVAERIDMRRVLRAMSERCRRVLLLKHFQGLSLKELAEHLGVTVNNAKQIVHRCTGEARRRFLGMDEP
jgi:RNA polymerase sigma-70 factor (ECF subfamily)